MFTLYYNEKGLVEPNSRVFIVIPLYVIVYDIGPIYVIKFKGVT